MVPPWAIPFDKRELRVMKPASFSVPKYLADLVHRAETGSKQAFHCVFRRGSQIKRRDADVACQRSAQRCDVGVSAWILNGNRRINLENAALGKKSTQRVE